MQFLSGKKTYIIAGLTVVIGVVQMLTGDASGLDAIMQNLPVVLGGLGLGTLRAGVSKGPSA